MLGPHGSPAPGLHSPRPFTTPKSRNLHHLHRQRRDPDSLTAHPITQLLRTNLPASRRRAGRQVHPYPNHDILSSDAQVEYHNADGTVRHTEPILARDYKVYKGDSWLRDADGWYHSGWARIMVRRDGESPLFEGAFTLGHDAHHIQLAESYLQTRHALDPEVEVGEGRDVAERMVVFRDSDVQSGFQFQGLAGRDVEGIVGRGYGVGDGELDVMCPSDRLGFNVQPGNPINKMILDPIPKAGWGGFGLESMFRGGLTKRQSVDGGDGYYGGSGNSAGVNLRTTIGSTDGCPTTRQVALIGVATDCTYTAEFSTTELARANIISQINSASDLFERTFNITLGLSTLVITDANCPGTAPSTAEWNVPCSSNVTIEDRLNLFSAWRGTRSDSNALWTLLTTCETGASVGLAWLGQLCVMDAQTQDTSTVSGANVIARTSTEWKVIAHEIGHTMGAVHDCTSTTCAASSTVSASQCCPLSATTCDADGRYLMNPSTSDQIEQFSPCSVGNICSAFKRRSVNTTCLTSNKDVQIITENECGNGIVEAGEDCDCGGTDGCGNNSCCNPTTCKFVDTAVCDDANEDCCRGCQFASASTVCRASNGPCDPAETCSGNSSTCPTDVIANDGTDCGTNLRCASGQCTSRDQQCQTIMGQYSNANDTSSCDNTNCQLTCSSPEFGANTCFGMQQNFLDGTPCAGDGTCKNGVCTGASALGEVRSWINRNRNVVIGVGSAIGAVILFSLLSCCWSRCRRRPQKKIPAQGGFVPAHDPRWRQPQPQLYPMPPPPVGRRPSNNRSRSSNRSGASNRGYPGGQPGQQGQGVPPVPPPSYNQGQSVRYA
ncbi:uncharacterized protein LAJ45_01675 [Morchella importuna]|uniref:uncharacterized protein n=1 Tax=Morchella importuna TaxID=1174673 RepID=UPI001E8EF43F|nr:uncharacterized protein LAJ45_01675 [Morchella importuna]KAH8153908.1 hypothetical protein LAJ45_01675 [Morchella importuna]